MTITENLKKASLKHLFNIVLSNKHLRRKAVDIIQQKAWHGLVENEKIPLSRKTRVTRYTLATGLLHRLEIAIERGLISPSVQHTLVDNFVSSLVQQNSNPRRQQFMNEYGFQPPLFILMSPEGKCNLNCTGCYANSSEMVNKHMDFDVADRILQEKKDLWGSKFTVISGGEPFIWRSQGKDIIDLMEKHNDQIFLLYTNGTLVTPELAEHLAECGNVSLAISVEGYEQETDARRGKGVYKKILQAFENLRNAGVPFGLSITATRENADTLLTDEMLDFYLDEQGATYIWIFQYMPIGRSLSFDLMVTPEQRLNLFRKMEHQVEKRHTFIVDFWNSGPYSFGCLSAGSIGGYFAIDWNANATPCVFFPYIGINIAETFKQGGNLNDVLFCPLFNKIREWQHDYTSRFGERTDNNQLLPCPIKDHFDEALSIIEKTKAPPLDGVGREILTNREFQREYLEYSDEVARLMQPIWEKEFVDTLHPGKVRT